MVIAYLKKLREEFEEQRIHIKEQILDCENKIKENDKFIKILEDSNDPNYEAFSPRQMNTFNRRKIVELQEEQETLADHLADLKNQLGEMAAKVDEITNVIRTAKGREVQLSELLELLSKEIKETQLLEKMSELSKMSELPKVSEETEISEGTDVN